MQVYLDESIMEIIVLIEGVHNDLGPIDKTSVFNSIDPICSSVTLLKGEDNILIDTGFKGFERTLISRLDEEGIACEDIDIVFNTHSHFDHCYNNYLFNNARIVFGQSILTAKKWDVYKEIIVPNIRIIKTPGHYPDHQSVLIHKKGDIWVIAGDALREDIIRDNDKWNLMNKEYIQSVKHIFSLADIIIPGHGAIIKNNAPEVIA